MTIVDLRSDTVTRPTPAMRAAMARAEVGDDVYGEDPTVNALQERVAALLGKEAALFVPSGSMANQIALKIHTRPGDDVIIGEGSHNFLYESGAGGAIAGVQFTIVGLGGLFRAADVEAGFKPDNHHFAPTRLVCVENTHNRGGGRVWPQEDVLRVAELARARGVRLHLDGARLLNAQAATGVPARTLAAPFHTASLCLSKGLGAPVGSLLAGSRELMHDAHRVRKMLGGGMRQAGILAAAGLHALDHHVDRLADDHANARAIWERLRGAPGLSSDGVSPETNILLVDLEKIGAEEAVRRAREAGVLVGAVGKQRLRLVTHLDVDRAACLRAADLLVACVAAA
ncbi:MAG: low-specificity L-threonine aldolase [Myxococcota bacterium]